MLSAYLLEMQIFLTEEMRKSLRIRAAETDMTLQDWVAVMIKDGLARQSREKGT